MYSVDRPVTMSYDVFNARFSRSTWDTKCCVRRARINDVFIQPHYVMPHERQIWLFKYCWKHSAIETHVSLMYDIIVVVRIAFACNADIQFNEMVRFLQTSNSIKWSDFCRHPIQWNGPISADIQFNEMVRFLPTSNSMKWSDFCRHPIQWNGPISADIQFNEMVRFLPTSNSMKWSDFCRHWCWNKTREGIWLQTERSY